jgi:CrcB protein
VPPLLLKLLCVAAGGAVGTLARYGTATLLRGWTDRTDFPLGTLAVNLAGCFVMGYLQALFEDRWLLREEYRLALLVGVLGGYTTFSTFGFETYALLRDGQFLRATVNLLLNNVLGVLLVLIGYGLGRGRM